MRIWVDFSDIVNWPLKHLTGIQRVVIHVGISLKKLHPDVNFFTFNPTSKEFHEIDPSTVEKALDCEMSHIKILERVANFAPEDVLYLLGGTWVHTEFIQEIKKLKNEIQFKIAHFIHDVTCIKVPHVHRDKSKEIMENWIKGVYEVTDYFLTNSQFSKEEILSVFKSYGYLPKEFIVARLGDDITKLVEQTYVPEKFKEFCLDPFILCVGSFEPRKNHLLLYQTWRLLFEKYQNNTPKLIIVGSKGWLTDDFKSLILRDPILKDKIFWIQNVLEDELKWLYQNCLFTVYPSYYEGWGLPVAESLAHGKFCIASSAASIPEISGDLIDYFNPYDSRECFKKIEKAYFDETYLKSREKLVIEKFKTTEWINTAKQCLQPIT